MTPFDYAVAAVVLLSAIVAAIRGAVREILNLAGWVAAFIVAATHADAVAPWLAGSVSVPELRFALAAGGLFFATLFLAEILSLLASRLVRGAGLGPVDRGIGAAFGVLRGGIIAVAAVALGGLTPLPQEPFWRNALLSRPLEGAALGLAPWLPQELARRIQYRR